LLQSCGPSLLWAAFDLLAPLAGGLLRPRGRGGEECQADGGEEEALGASFAAAARGFGAQKALLLLVEEQSPLRLRAICTTGKLSADQIRACERGKSVSGVSPSVIRSVLASQRPELVEDARLRSEASGTPSLAEGGAGDPG